MNEEVERDFARYRVSNGLPELVLIATSTREAVVALGVMSDRAFVIDMSVTQDSVEKVMLIHRSCYRSNQVRDDGKDESDHQSNINRLDKGEELKHASSRRDVRGKEYRDNRHSHGERVTQNPGSLDQRKTYRGSGGRWLNVSLKNIFYDGSTDGETFVHQFKSAADQMGLDSSRNCIKGYQLSKRIPSKQSCRYSLHGVN